MINIKDDKLYYIGGVVRDELLGKESFDTDLTFQGDAIEFCKNLEKRGHGQIIQVNLPFGTVHMEIDGKEVDIASTRDEIYDKKGHLPFVSDIGCDLKKDVLRRDFTINALAKSTVSGEIIDYAGGVDDIKNKKLRVLHDDSFVDDPTRIIRGLKFSVRFGFNLEEDTRKLQENYLNNINYDMSYKRVKKELIETFNLNSNKAFEEFFNQKIYKLLTEKDVTPPKYDIESLVNSYPVENTWLVYLGWMDLEKLPLTKAEKKIVDDFHELINEQIDNNDFSIYKAFKGKTKESILIYTLFTDSTIGLRFFEIEPIKISISGDDLISIGFNPSEKFSACFEHILKHKLENPNMSITDEIKLAKDFLKN